MLGPFLLPQPHLCNLLIRSALFLSKPEHGFLFHMMVCVCVLYYSILINVRLCLCYQLIIFGAPLSKSLLYFSSDDDCDVFGLWRQFGRREFKVS